MRTNRAAWLPAVGARLEVGPAPDTAPGANEIVVATRAVAVNPIDWILQLAGDLAFSWIAYPFVLGSDCAGEVVAVGSAVTRFAVGDRVLGHAVGTDPKRKRSAEGTFQTYAVLLEDLASPIPGDMSYEDATVLPLGLSTAACALFQKGQLALELPTATPHPKGQTLLVWGGSTSVGSNAIQLAVAAGYDVVTTCSPKNFAYVEALGASRAFDYNDPNVVATIVAALAGTTIVGAVAIGAGAIPACLRVVRASRGKKVISIATFPIAFEDPKRPGKRVGRVSVMRQFASFAIPTWLACRVAGIRTNFIFGSSLARDGVGRAIYADFLPGALTSGRYVAAPPPHVVGSGLEAIQAGLDLQRAGVSASKVVITLPAP